MKILALDLGTSTGFCHNLFSRGLLEDADTVEAGAWQLATAKEIAAWGKTRITRRRDPRVERLHNLLSKLPAPDVVCYEDVQFASYTKQVQLWSSFRAAVWLAFPANAFIECVPVGTLKKFATGSGAADKDAMAAALYREYPELKSRKLNSDAVDAIWLFNWAVKNLSRMKL